MWIVKGSFPKYPKAYLFSTIIHMWKTFLCIKLCKTVCINIQPVNISLYNNVLQGLKYARIKSFLNAFEKLFLWISEGFIHIIHSFVDNFVDKCVEFMGFIGLIHRIHRISRKVIPRGGDKCPFSEFIQESFEQGKCLHIFYVRMNIPLGFNGTTDIVNITL